jgi:hypothetical protein
MPDPAGLREITAGFLIRRTPTIPPFPDNQNRKISAHEFRHLQKAFHRQGTDSLHMNQPDLFDICANRHRGAETSVSANLRVEKNTDRALVLSLLCLSPAGKTLDEVSAVLGRPPNQLSGRFTELVAAGQISKTDERRNTRTGATAAVYQFKRK